MKNKLNNYGLWISLSALLCLILQDTIAGFDVGRYDLYVDTFLGVLIAAGIVSDPKTGKWFKDNGAQK